MDYIGLGLLLTVTMGGMQIMLDKGKRTTGLPPTSSASSAFYSLRV
jgi:hypothetical protein